MLAKSGSDAALDFGVHCSRRLLHRAVLGARKGGAELVHARLARTEQGGKLGDAVLGIEARRFFVLVA